MNFRQSSVATSLRLSVVLGILWSAPTLFAVDPPPAVTGANVDESRVEQTLYVDPANPEAADDDRHGTAEAPFATLHYGCLAAAKAKDANRGVKLLLANGTYRETAEVPAPASQQKDTDAPLVIEAAERDQAIIDGADTEGWTPSTWKIENGRWKHPWPIPLTNYGQHSFSSFHDSSEGTVYRRGELLFVNDLSLQQVATEADLVPGSFWIDTPRTAPARHGSPPVVSTVVVQPPEGTDLAGAIVQVSLRAAGLDIRARRNVVVRGVTCQHIANPAGLSDPGYKAGLNFGWCSNVLVEDVLSQWNNNAGAEFFGVEGLTVRRLRALHNGMLGMQFHQSKNVLAEECEVSFNAFRPEWAKLKGGSGLGAIASLGTEGMTWRRLHAVGNVCPGLRFNGGSNLTIEQSMLTGNLSKGLQVDFCAGPVRIHQCVIADTKAYPNGGQSIGDGGVVLTGSPDVTLESNVIACNAVTQLALIEPLYRVYWDKLRAERHEYRHNVFYGRDASQFLCKVLEGENTKGPVVPNYRTFNADENCFWNPALETGFATYTLNSYTPSYFSQNIPASALNPTIREQPGMTFEQWQAWWSAHANPHVAGEVPAKSPEAHSLWQDPAFINPAEGDFRLQEKSPVATWNLSAEDVAGGQ